MPSTCPSFRSSTAVLGLVVDGRGQWPAESSSMTLRLVVPMEY